MIARDELVRKVQNSVIAFIIDEDLAENTYIKDKKQFLGNIGIGGIAINKDSQFCWLLTENEQYQFIEGTAAFQEHFFHDILNKFANKISDLF